MGLIEKQQLLSQLSPPLDHLLASQLLDEFISLERRFIQRDWEPTELDGGQFSEILARIIYHQDSGNLNRAKGVEECASYITNEATPHAISPRHTAIHLLAVIKTIYKFRSQRGAVHISPTYGPNHMDARLIVENARWAMNETLRVFWNGDRDVVAKTIRELLQFDVPCIGTFDEVILVQRTDLSPEEEMLVLLHYGGEIGLSRTELGNYARCSAASVTRSLQRLEAPTHRQIIKLKSGNFRLTDLGSKRIREQLAEKLLLQ